MKALIILAFAFLFFPEGEAKVHPYDKTFERELVEKFFAEGTLSAAKVEIHRQRLQQKISEISSLIGDDKKAKKSDSIIALKLADKLLSQLETADEGERFKLAATALELEDAVKIEGDNASIFESIRHLRNMIQKWTIPLKSFPEDEASDLFDPAKISFLDAHDYKGQDLSQFDPDPRSPFWRDPSKKSFFYGVDFSFPKTPVVEFDEMKFSDTKPKMDVFVKDSAGKKTKYKLKFGAEIHADPTLASIMTKLGFGVDQTRYVKNIRVNLGKKYTLDMLKRDWETYYRRDNHVQYLIENYIQESGKDEKGEYVIFKEGLYEAKPADISRVGGWSFKEQGHPSLRSVRALVLIQAWLQNTDIKQYGNNRVLVRGDETMNIVSDLGKSLGGHIGERPELLNPSMVTGRTADSLTISYLAIHDVAVKNKITFADARWTGRLIAGLTREDYTSSVSAGGWPKCVQDIYVERIISRRNDLLKNLNLMGERDRNDQIIRPIAVKSETSFHEMCAEADFSQNTVNFDYSLRNYLTPVARSLRNALLDMGTNAFGQKRKITLSGADLGFQKGVISQVIFDVRREVEQNPAPKGSGDLYIVKDHFEVGFRMGVSFGIYKDFIYTRSYSLAYPVNSKAEARFNNGFLLNFFLPRDAETLKLPPSYVLHTDHFFEKGVGVEYNNRSQIISPALRVRASAARIFRSILDHRNSDRIIIYRDRTDYAEVFLRAFARVGLIRLPLMTTFARWGKASGAGVILTSKEAAALDLGKAVIDGDFSELTVKENQFALSNNFREQDFNWSLIFFGGRNYSRFERIHLEKDGEGVDLVQYRTDRNRSWNFFGNAEKRSTTIEVVAGRKSSDYQLKVTSLVLDSGATDKELQHEYLKFVNGLSPDKERIIPFSPELGYSTNGKWGRLETRSETTFYAEAINRIVSLNEETFWNTLALHLKVSRPKLDQVIKDVLEAQEEMRGSSVSRKNDVLKAYGLNESDYELVMKARDFIRQVMKLRLVSDTPTRLKKLGSLFKKISSSTKDSRILGALIRISGEDNYFTSNIISPPLFAEMNTIEGIPLVGVRGKARADQGNYLNYIPDTPLELYSVFDGWRLNK